MSYNYDTLEQALEQAAYRLPVKTLGSLISKAEHIISVNADSHELECEIQSMLGKTNVFALKKLNGGKQHAVSVAA